MANMMRKLLKNAKKWRFLRTWRLASKGASQNVFVTYYYIFGIPRPRIINCRAAIICSTHICGEKWSCMSVHFYPFWLIWHLNNAHSGPNRHAKYACHPIFFAQILFSMLILGYNCSRNLSFMFFSISWILLVLGPSKSFYQKSTNSNSKSVMLK